MPRNDGATVAKAITKLRTQDTLALAASMDKAHSDFLENIAAKPEEASMIVAGLESQVRSLLMATLVPGKADA